MQIGLREANQQFSKLVKAVKEGREVLLTERGRPLAVLKSIRVVDKAQAAIQRLETAGFLRPAAKRGNLPVWNPKPIRGRRPSKKVR